MDIINELDLNGTLKIVQNKNMNNFTMDSVLLAGFVKLTKKDKNIVDLCAGNCPVGMLLTLKKRQISVKCVELQEENVKLGQKSIEMNKLENELEIINDNLINISEKIGKNKYDIITCNPPYFKVDSTSNLNTNKSYSIARHEIEVNLEQIISESKKLLRTQGRIYFVHRPERIDEIILLLNKYDFELKKLRFVSPYRGKDSNTVLVEAKKGKTMNNKVKVLDQLYIYEDIDKYTSEMLQIMNMEE